MTQKIEIWDADKIRASRTVLKMERSTAAEFLNITPVYLSMIENGMKQPSPKVIHRMSGLYRQPIASFLKAEKNFAQV